MYVIVTFRGLITAVCTKNNFVIALAKQIAVVSSKLDYCNSLFHNMPEKDIAIARLLFHNMPEKDIARLQLVQSCLARVVTKTPRVSRSVLILKQLGLH